MEAPARPLERKIQRRFVPFAAVGLLAILSSALPPRPSSWALVAAAAALTLAIAAAGVLAPWSRLPRWTYVVPPLAYFVVVALLRQANGGSVSGYAPLVLLPVIWVAINLGRWEVTLAIGAGIAVLVLPLLIGDSSYGSGEWRRAIISASVAAITGFSLESLVRDKRRQAREAREQARVIAEQEQTMATIARVARELTLSGNTRELICQAALEVSGGNLAAILEPDGEGNLVLTARAGSDPGRYRFPLGSDPSGSGVAFAAGKPFFVADAREHPALPQDIVRKVGFTSALFEPIIRDGRPVGVLVVTWAEPLEDIATRAGRGVALLAAEAASAMHRADVLVHVQALAETDDLTGLPNRRSWEAKLREAIADSARGHGPICVALVDLDHFKEYNDRHGHQSGDRLLKTAASSWRESLRQGDLLARYGGEEFAVALPCRLAEAEDVLERLRSLTPEGLTCSIGVAEWSSGESDVELVARADEALYAAKHAGRDALVTAS